MSGDQHNWVNDEQHDKQHEEFVRRIRQMFLEGKLTVEISVDGRGRLMYVSVMDKAEGIDVFTKPVGLPVKEGIK